MSSVRNLVNKSDNYKEFDWLAYNRDINENHVQELIKAFEEQGNFTKEMPILVNENMQIIDGQHRFLALKELGLPIYYTVVEGTGIEQARSINRLHRNWTLMDWIESYAASGNPHYRKLLELIEIYSPVIAPSVVMTYLLGGSARVPNSGGAGSAFRALRNGEFVVEDLDGALVKLDQLSELIEINPDMKTRPVARAFNVIAGSPSYDHERMLNKTRRFGDRMWKKYQDIDDLKRQFEQLYNFNAREHVTLY